MKYKQSIDARPGMEQETILVTASVMLAEMGLTLDDIKSKKRVLDLGSNTHILERAAKMLGINNVISLDKNSQNEFHDGLSMVRANASALPFSPETMDLIISKSSNFFYANTVNDALLQLKNCMQALTEKGELRISPIRFGFIRKHMMQDESVESSQELSGELSYETLAKQSEATRSPGETSRLIAYNLEADRQTLDFLRSRKIKFEKMRVDLTSLRDDFKDFIILPKQDVN